MVKVVALEAYKISPVVNVLLPVPPFPVCNIPVTFVVKFVVGVFQAKDAGDPDELYNSVAFVTPPVPYPPKLKADDVFPTAQFPYIAAFKFDPIDQEEPL